MAERRMFSKSIMESDNFCELSDKSKLLYLYLNLNADDDGFIGSVRKILLFTDADKNALEELINSNYVIRFSSGVCVITHWRAHNYLRNDRYHPTLFHEEAAQLKFDVDSKTYVLVDNWYTNGSQSGRHLVDVVKTRQDKTREDENSTDETSEDESHKSFNEIGNRIFDSEGFPLDC